ncbi:glycoprotein-N-acetylgalactosamine 3-beta-galactosyltransferase 1-like [Pecten maximus]|uniref:glycoprotein-N-acetylgalactosamine 3-beta-galactosyltransferase 1-like n=1 Tax=Pecten maximus TaxID=6579 RepID=UPI00145804EA|nr:glycoprotein-N-acetylgalactosamine 3-beta-galactosyltransferase 1-like [Pecten maximus]
MTRVRILVLSLPFFVLCFVYVPLMNTTVRNNIMHVIKARGYVSPNIATLKVSSTDTSGVRLLCWIMTSPQTVVSKATHVQNTWGKRCDKLLFMSSNGTKEQAKHLPVVELPVKEGREQLWQKTKEAFLHIYSLYLHDYDWFLKADDDTYVIVENLRHFLSNKNQKEAIYYGRRFKPYVKQGFMSGGAGYVLSREAIRSLILIGNSTTTYLKSKCAEFFIGEDVQLGRCLELVGVKAGDTRDLEGKERFFPLNPEDHIVPGSIPRNSWYWSHLYYPHIQGCSRSVISFHYIKPKMMYALDYFVYNMTLPTK